MVLGISLIIISLAGLAYGIIRKRRVVTILSVTSLAIIAIIWIVYSYLYSLNPY